MRRILLALALAFIPGIIPAVAQANTSTATLLSCGEADFTVSREPAPWRYTVLEDGKQTATGTFSSQLVQKISIGVRASDDLAHVVTVSVVNTARGDGASSQTALFVACGPAVGPMGPAGTPGIGLPGKDGRDGVNATSTTIIERTTIHDAPATCTSRRAYSFRVRKAYEGHRVVGVSAREPGMDVKVKKKAGRFVVSWSTAGKTFTAGGVVRTMTVTAKLERRRQVRLVWLYRPCLGKDGNPNDPSAAGQGSSGNGEPVRATIRTTGER